MKNKTLILLLLALYSCNNNPKYSGENNGALTTADTSAVENNIDTCESIKLGTELILGCKVNMTSKEYNNQKLELIKNNSLRNDSMLIIRIPTEQDKEQIEVLSLFPDFEGCYLKSISLNGILNKDGIKKVLTSKYGKPTETDFLGLSVSNEKVELHDDTDPDLLFPGKRLKKTTSGGNPFGTMVPSTRKFSEKTGQPFFESTSHPTADAQMSKSHSISNTTIESHENSNSNESHNSFCWTTKTLKITLDDVSIHYESLSEIKNREIRAKKLENVRNEKIKNASEKL